MSEFKAPLVSTITATADLGCGVDIVTVAKRLPLDDVIKGTKLTYAEGAHIIVRGQCKMPRSKSGFYNQTSLVVAISGQRQVHVKIFNNGSLQIAGPKTMHEVMEAWERTRNALLTLRGCSSVDVQCLGSDSPLMGSDDLLYSTNGDVIGWVGGKGKYFVHEGVVLEEIDGAHFFVSATYRKGAKRIYSLDGVAVGTRVLAFSDKCARRKYSVENGKIFAGSDIVGSEVTTMSSGWQEDVTAERARRRVIAQRGRLLNCHTALLGKTASPNPDKLLVHMVNAVFQSPFSIIREKLHRRFLADDLVSRWDPCANPGVNLRFYDNPLTRHDPGRCPCKNRILCCSCKKINLRCFESGTIIVTGLKDVRQVDVIHAFVADYYRKHRSDIEKRPGA